MIESGLYWLPVTDLPFGVKTTSKYLRQSKVSNYYYKQQIEVLAQKTTKGMIILCSN